MEFLGTKGDWIHTKRYDHHIEVDGKVLITIHCLESGKPKYDGRLVSKAPEMLEMLKILIQDIEEEGNHSRQTGYDLEEAKRLIKEATEL